jgi:hypothetical protein
MSILSDDEWALISSAMNAFMHSEALASACELGLFTTLSRSPGARVPEIAAALEIGEYPARVLLLGCSSAGLVRHDASGGYYNSSAAEKVLVAGKAGDFTPFVKFTHDVQQRCAFHLTRALRAGTNTGLDEFPGEGHTLYERFAGRPELESLFHAGMAAYTRLAPKVLDVEELSGVSHLLDVGGGTGPNAIALCRRYPDLRVTLLDKPSVCAIAETTIREAGLSERITCTALDLFADPWPRGADGVLMSHLVEIFSPDKVAALYRSAFEALEPGGRAFVWTIMCDDGETGPLQAAKSSIYFLSTASGEGFTYPEEAHHAWLSAAGFRDVKCHRFRAFAHGAMTAVR